MFYFADTQLLVYYVYINLGGVVGLLLMLSIFGPAKKLFSLKTLFYGIFCHLFIPCIPMLFK